MGERATVSVVFNGCYGGFSLSDAGVRRYAEIKGIQLYAEHDRISRLPTYWTVPKNARPDRHGRLTDRPGRRHGREWPSSARLPLPLRRPPSPDR